MSPLRSWLDSPTVRWRFARVFQSLRRIEEIVKFIPNRQDTVFSTMGKIYALGMEAERQIGFVSDREWFRMEAEARGFQIFLLPWEFVETAPSVESVTAHPRGSWQASSNNMSTGLGNYLLEVTTNEGHQAFVPARLASYDLPPLYNQCGRVVLARDQEAFDCFLDSLWEGYKNQIFVDSRYEYNPRSYGYSDVTSFEGVHFNQDAYVGREDLLKKMADEYEQTKKDRRCWLLLGPSGTGKTTFVQHLAHAVNARFMHISYSVVESRQFAMILSTKPDFLLIDDADRIWPSKLKESLDYLGNLGISSILTANDATKFDAAILRPGRVDRVLEFGLPTPEERRAVFTSYLTQNKKEVTDDQLARLVKSTEGLSQGHCKEVVIRVATEPFEDAVQSLEVMTRLAAQVAAKEKEAAEAPVAKKAKEARSKTRRPARPTRPGSSMNGAVKPVS